MNWCIVSNEALINPAKNETIQQLVNGDMDIGVCHDGRNWLFTSTPIVIEDDHVIYVNHVGKTDIQLVREVGSFLKADSLDTVLFADSSVFSMLYDHTIFKMWCGRYVDKASLIADYFLIFGDDLDESDTLENLIAIARSSVYDSI